jgi:internalin A
MKTIMQGDRVLVVLSKKYLESVYCMSELYGVFLHSRSNKADFLSRIVPLTLSDVRIFAREDRVAHARHWKTAHEAISWQDVKDGLVCPEEDCMEWMQIGKWATTVAEMLKYIADTLHPTSFATLCAADFAPLKSLLERGP